ncbi:hypothetical protein CG471_05920 [Sphingobium sp. IP1]|uniref:Uncharacterized protein n=1 Tax=Sphingobium yanoikuyae TaxID=13690 RepID=A0A3G2UST5_SPHYA|nr:hypothetical protein EBF16_02080 [Sphingobium yanoikuyae]PHP20752.1 hypothetical protein CG471_05920 [Sphingobium sp. IP1]RSU72972.1 hypothetical protein BRX37_16980 [Sphingomonas sp. S-NIH.Pt3_0716]
MGGGVVKPAALLRQIAFEKALDFGIAEGIVVEAGVGIERRQAGVERERKMVASRQVEVGLEGAGFPSRERHLDRDGPRRDRLYRRMVADLPC